MGQLAQNGCSGVRIPVHVQSRRVFKTARNDQPHVHVSHLIASKLSLEAIRRRNTHDTDDDGWDGCSIFLLLYVHHRCD